METVEYHKPTNNVSVNQRCYEKSKAHKPTKTECNCRCAFKDLPPETKTTKYRTQKKISSVEMDPSAPFTGVLCSMRRGKTHMFGLDRDVSTGRSALWRRRNSTSYVTARTHPPKKHKTNQHVKMYQTHLSTSMVGFVHYLSQDGGLVDFFKENVVGIMSHEDMRQIPSSRMPSGSVSRSSESMRTKKLLALFFLPMAESSAHKPTLGSVQQKCQPDAEEPKK